MMNSTNIDDMSPPRLETQEEGLENVPMEDLEAQPPATFEIDGVNNNCDDDNGDDAAPQQRNRSHRRPKIIAGVVVGCAVVALAFGLGFGLTGERHDGNEMAKNQQEIVSFSSSEESVIGNGGGTGDSTADRSSSSIEANNRCMDGYKYCETTGDCLVVDGDDKCEPLVATPPILPDNNGTVTTADNCVGCDEDEHGCIPSAGYEWCEALNECIQPWNTTCPTAGRCMEGYEWCPSIPDCLPIDGDIICPTMATISPMPGSDRDDHGCIPSAGYQWCATLNECIQPFKTVCPTNVTAVQPIMPGSDVDSHGCIPSAGYSWCESLGECIQNWNTTCPPCYGCDADANGCIPSAGYEFCESLGRCIKPSETVCPVDTPPVAAEAPTEDTTTPPSQTVDEHGCVMFVEEWCELENQCVENWSAAACHPTRTLPVATEEPTEDVPTPPSQMVGGDRDEYGCVPSAGFEWCETLGYCIQPWNTTCPSPCWNETGIDDYGCAVFDGFEWCETLGQCVQDWNSTCPLTFEGDTDEHGCIPSAGYHWCESRGECIQPWNTTCPPCFGCDADHHGCLPSAGYEWCETLDRCIPSSNATCPESCTRVGGDRDDHGCIPSAGYEWCGSLDECIRPWETTCPLTTPPTTNPTPSPTSAPTDQPTPSPTPSPTDNPTPSPTPAPTHHQHTPRPTPQPTEPCLGCDKDEHGCVPSAGEKWCERENQCVQNWSAADCHPTLPPIPAPPAPTPPTPCVECDKDDHGCIPSAGEKWCNHQNQCVQNWSVKTCGV